MPRDSIEKRAADRLAYECSRMIDQQVLGERSGVADALLDYANIGGVGGPNSIPEWQEQYLKRRNEQSNG